METHKGDPDRVLRLECLFRAVSLSVPEDKPSEVVHKAATFEKYVREGRGAE